MKFATVVIPFAYTPRWIQICISSLKSFKNVYDFDIIIMDNSPDDRRDIKSISETSLSDGVQIVKSKLRSHGGALDHAIELVHTPWFFGFESDCSVNKDGWLDWYASFIKDDYVSMIGWYWQRSPDSQDDRHYINSSATLYNSRILKLLLGECKRNPDSVICYGKDYEKRKEQPWFSSLVKNNLVGPFSESRGFQHQKEYPIIRDYKWWQEPGNWVYNRCSQQWECIRVPGELVYNRILKAPEYKYNYYGVSDDEAFVRHYWAGTVSHNFDKHLVVVPWEIDCIEWWLTREYKMWEQYVPESVRKHSLKNGLVKSFDEEMKYAKSRIHLLNQGDLIRAYHNEVIQYITKESPEPTLEKDGLAAKIVGYSSADGLWIIEFEVDPPEDNPYHMQRKENGKWYANAHPLWCVKR